jgi:hypothetical protein
MGARAPLQVASVVTGLLLWLAYLLHFSSRVWKSSKPPPAILAWWLIPGGAGSGAGGFPGPLPIRLGEHLDLGPN